MKALSATTKMATITISKDELAFLCNTINESLEALEDWEFSTRTGMSRNQALDIHAAIGEILNKMPKV